MSFYDVMAMSFGNLWRRKLRTFLTVLGVLIGTASVVAMISLAVGMKQMMMEEYSRMGSATQIRVRSSADMMSESEKTDANTLLTDSNLSMFEQMEYVQSVSPSLSFDVNLEQGKYSGYAMLVGVSREVMENQTLGKGELPAAGGGSLQLLAGNTILTSFGYSLGDEYYDYYSTGELPDIDLMRQIRQVKFYDYSAEDQTTDDETADAGQDTGYGDGGDASGDGAETDAGADAGMDSGADTGTDADTGMSGVSDLEVDNTAMFRVKITGILEGGPDDYAENSQNLLVDIDALKSYLIKNFGKANIPGQPKIKGRPLKDWVYTEFVVDVDDTDHVEEVTQAIQDMGFEAESNKELLESIQQSLQIVELTLGGIGMVAFLVAAIGIANTMMMSTYERTKEIGVMKVLGCNMKDIRKLFLMEAAGIGFIGGVVGLGFTFIVSTVLNSFAGSAEGINGNISVIPWWLALTAIAFSTLMGMLAGYFPARRAMKLSPLAAIRTE